MAKPRKLTVVRYHDAEGRECRKDTPGAVKTTEQTADYYGAVPQPTGRAKMVKLCGDFTRSKSMLTRLRADAQEGRLGIRNPFAGHAARHVREHLDDYAARLADDEDGPAHVRKTTGRNRAVLEGVGAETLADLEAGAAARYLAERRADGTAAELEPGVESFRPGEAARILGVSITALGKAVKLHGLAASGNGKARRLPRATVQTLLDRAARGISAETRNHYARALRAFGAWLAGDKRVEFNPFASLKLVKTSSDRRHDRRVLDPEECRLLFAAALASAKVYRGIDGPSRRLLYSVAVNTGLRVRALAGLTPERFALDGDRPRIEMPATLSKNKRGLDRSISRAIADELRPFLASRPKGVPVWPGNWKNTSSEMIRVDLGPAGIPYVVQGRDGPLYADFHALRHTHATLNRQAGADLDTVRRMMGHSTAEMTARYVHADDGHQAAERVSKLLEG